MPNMPWKTQQVGPSQGQKPGPPPWTPMISAAPSADPYDWAMMATAYLPQTGITSIVRFGHADQTAAPVTEMIITGNDSGVTLAGELAVLIVVSDVAAGDTLPVFLTAEDTTGDSWTPLQMGGTPQSGYLYYSSITASAHDEADTITLTSPKPLRMIGGLFAVHGTQQWKLAGSEPPIPTGRSTAAQCPTPQPYTDCDDVVVICSANGTPNDPAGWTSGGGLVGAELFARVSWARVVNPPS